jgi:hypothetical protein
LHPEVGFANWRTSGKPIQNPVGDEAERLGRFFVSTDDRLADRIILVIS